MTRKRISWKQVPPFFRLYFTDIMVYINPAVVRLRNGSSTIAFELVNEVRLEHTSLGDDATVICCGENFEYTILIVIEEKTTGGE